MERYTSQNKLKTQQYLQEIKELRRYNDKYLQDMAKNIYISYHQMAPLIRQD